MFASLALASGITLGVACSSSDDTDPSSTPDSGVDAGPRVDSGLGDAGTDALILQRTPFKDAPACPAGDASAPPEALPKLLSQTGLYSNIQAKTITPGVLAYTPTFTLWSDGAEKRRWVSLPKGCKIDTNDMDHWNFPVGTRFWKEFVVNNKPIEVRLIVRTGPKSDDFAFMSYAWRSNGSDADAVPDGVINALGTQHDVPPVAHCLTCHGYLPEHVLGFGAVELSSSKDVNLESLAKDGWLSAPPAQPVKVPGDAKTATALGYLHANCSNCHNEYGIPFQSPFSMRLSVKNVNPEDTDVYRTALKQPLDRWCGTGVSVRLNPGVPNQSCVYVRPNTRSNDMLGQMQMPPIGSDVRDDAGLAGIEAWISSLPN